MKHWITEQTATGVILFDGEAASREDAFECYAQDGGCESYDQLRRLTGPEAEDLYYEERRREDEESIKGYTVSADEYEVLKNTLYR
jgi:hypothetical protein